MNDSSDITLFIDEDCPLCSIEYAWLSRLNKDDKVSFVNINADEFDATHYGISQREFEMSIKARRQDGTWISGVEAFRAVYETLGFSRLVSCSRLFPISLFLYVFYEIFRRIRIPFGQMFRFFSRIVAAFGR